MAAVAAPRMHGGFQSHDLPLIRKPFDPLAAPLPGLGGEEGEECQAMDADDDFSDHDSHYSQDLPEDFDFRLGLAPGPPPQPDVTQQLLTFAQTASSDIQRFFGRKRDEEDSCDIYEDKWVTTKSGRELYYADLLRMAQGDGEGGKRGKGKGGGNLSPIDTDNRHQFSGRADRKLGLGPLEELFDVGLRQVRERQQQQQQQQRQQQQHQQQDRRQRRAEAGPGGAVMTQRADVVPMHERRLPDSFFQEPRGEGGAGGEARGEGPIHGLLGGTKPPDFQDLLQNWTASEHSDLGHAMAADGRDDTSRHVGGARV